MLHQINLLIFKLTNLLWFDINKVDLKELGL